MPPGSRQRSNDPAEPQSAVDGPGRTTAASSGRVGLPAAELPQRAAAPGVVGSSFAGRVALAPSIRAATARPKPVAQIVNLLSRRLVVGQASVQPSASGAAGAPRIANPRYGRLPACATAAQQTPVAGIAAQTSWERGASLRTKVRGPTGGAMLRAPSVAQIAPSVAQIVPSVAQIGNLPSRRLVVGQASVQPSASGDAAAPRIANPRYGRLPACATDHSWRH
jgi:hypothetical protein